MCERPAIPAPITATPMVDFGTGSPLIAVRFAFLKRFKYHQRAAGIAVVSSSASEESAAGPDGPDRLGGGVSVRSASTLGGRRGRGRPLPGHGVAGAAEYPGPQRGDPAEGAGCRRPAGLPPGSGREPARPPPSPPARSDVAGREQLSRRTGGGSAER